MYSLPYTMTANKTYLSTYFPFKTSLFIKRMSLINKVNFKKCFSENYRCMRLTTRVYGIYVSTLLSGPREYLLIACAYKLTAVL